MDNDGNKTLYSKRHVKAGEIVLESEAIVVKIKKEFISTYCSNCLSSIQSKVTCNGCNYISYCSDKCQQEHTYLHRYECFKDLQLVPERVRFIALALATNSPKLFQMTS